MLLLTATLATCQTADIRESELQELAEFGDNPGQLRAWFYQPEQPEALNGLVVVLHGCGQTAADIAEQSGWNRLAAQHGFAVLYPEQQPGNNMQNCFNWFIPDDIQRGSGEAASVQHMVQTLAQKLGLGPEQTYLSGLSAGGAMVAVLMASYPEAYTAGAIHSGVPYGAASDLAAGLKTMQGNTVKSPEEWGALVTAQHADYGGPYPRLAIFHGPDDPIVSPINATELVKQWGALLQADLAQPQEEAGFQDNERVTRLSYTDAAGNPLLLKYDIDGLGHAWAVDPGTEAQQGGTVATFAKDVDFFATYWMAQFFGLANP